MAVDRTTEIFETARKGLKPSTLEQQQEEEEQDTPTQSLLRNRHVRKGSPKSEAESSSSASTPIEDTGPTFGKEAATVNTHLSEAAASITTLKRLKNNDAMQTVQRVLDLSNQRILELQDLHDKLAEQRALTKGGWFSLFRGEEEKNSQDEHEVLIIKFLTHRASTLMAESYDLREEKKPVISLEHFVPIHPYPSTAATSTKHEASQVPAPPKSSSSAPTLGDSQMQMLLSENEHLMKEYSEMQNRITATQSDMNEISRLQNTLQEHIVHQAEQIERIFDDAQVTIGTLTQANQYLKQAGKGQSTSVRFFIISVLFMSFLLLLLHFISD